MRRTTAVLLVVAIGVTSLFVPPAAAATPTVIVTASVLGPLAAVPVDVSGGPANATDWLGVYLVGTPDWDYKTWAYLGGNGHTPPAQGIAGMLGWIEGPAAGGLYEVRFFANNGYTKLATSNAFTVTATTPLLNPNARTVPAGGTVTVFFSGGPGNRTDWLAVVADGTPDSAYLDWKYLNDSRTAPATGRTAGSVTLTMPSAPGQYRVAFLLNDGLTSITSVPIGVTAATIPRLLASSSVGSSGVVAVGPGAVVTVFFNGTSGAARDWIGLYPDFGFGGVKPPLTSYLDWRYLNDSRTPPSVGLTSGSVTFTMPTTPGSFYWVRLLANDGYTEIGEADEIVVAYTSSVTPSLLSVPAGGRITANIDASLGHTTDWVGLYLASAPDTAYLDWEYLNGTRTPPARALYASTSTMFTVPSTPGIYQFRLFSSNGFTRLASSGTFTVT